ncbi:MAG TPA: hypothetical protein VN698_05745 [Bacteroidia bacterium]|nr:hypothetical protein [Bacteroidia bacterium]
MLIGKVVSFTEGKKFYEFEIDVIKSYKGVKSSKIKVLSSKSGASCGILFSVGTIWLLDCNKEGDKYYTSSCGFNINNSESEFSEDTAYLSVSIKKNGYVKFKSFEGHLRNGKPEGFWKSYTPNYSIPGGDVYYLYASGYYRNGRKEGKWIIYNTKGDTTAGFEFYKNGKGISTWKYFDDLGNLTTEVIHKKHGFTNTDFITDSTKLTYYYNYWEHSRVQKIFDNNNHLIKELVTPFIGKVHYKEFYKNGVIKEEGCFSKKHRYYCGVWNYYDDAGLLIRKKKWKKDHFHDDENLAGADENKFL